MPSHLIALNISFSCLVLIAIVGSHLWAVVSSSRERAADETRNSAIA